MVEILSPKKQEKSENLFFAIDKKCMLNFFANTYRMRKNEVENNIFCVYFI